MSFMEWISRMLGHTQERRDSETRVILDEHKAKQVTELAKLTGTSPDQVRADARRRVLAMEHQSMRNRR